MLFLQDFTLTHASTYKILTLHMLILQDFTLTHASTYKILTLHMLILQDFTLTHAFLTYSYILTNTYSYDK